MAHSFTRSTSEHQNDYFILINIIASFREIYNPSTYGFKNTIYRIQYLSSSIWVQIQRVFYLTLHPLSFPPNHQDFAVQELPSTKRIQHVESVDMEEQGQPQRSYEQQEKNVHDKARQQHTLNKAGDEKKYEPCPRWKNLGLMSPCGYVIIPCKMCAEISSAYHVLCMAGIPLVEEKSFR